MELTDRERLSVNLKVAREAKGVTQRAAAEALGVVRGTIVNWENPQNAAEPSSDQVSRLGALYGVSSRDLRFAALARQPAAASRPLDRVAMDEGEVAQPTDKKKAPAKQASAKTGTGQKAG